jgi:crotonobetaine/carnitine-CoA ligase
MKLDHATASAWSVGALLRERAERHGDDPFVVGTHTVSYADAHLESSRLASVLAELGIGAQDTVATLLGNGPEILANWFATAKLGAIEVPLNPVFRGASLEYLLNHCEAKVLLVDGARLEALAHLGDRLTHLQTLIVVGAPQAEIPWTVLPYADAVAAAEPLERPDVDPGELLAVLYTSGTTGHPKGVIESHRCAMHWGVNYAEHMQLGPEDTNYLFPPLFHTMSQFMGVVPALLTGGRVAVREGFSASRFWHHCREDRVTLFNFTGGVLSFLWKQPERPDDADNPVTRALGVPIPDDLYPGFESRFGVTLLPCFGTSESNVVSFSRPGAVRRGSSGRPIDAFEVRIVDDDGAEVARGERGEIVTRPRHPDSMMRGYYRRPEATVTAFRDLWYHTGDLGYRDEDGYLFFVDRKKDAIRRRGENISSFEIERVIDRLPEVLESAAVGVPSEHGEEEVKLVVVLQPGAELDAAAVWAYCEVEMAPFMVPRFIEFRDALPRTQTERVRKFELREAGVHAGVLDREAVAAP